ANAEYARRFSLGGLTGHAGKGLAVLTCMDSRIEPLQMLGLVPGEAKILRNAGARVDDGVIAALALAHERPNVTRAAVVAHPNCVPRANRSKIRPSSSGGIPGPESSTAMRRCRSCRRASIRIGGAP